MELMLVAADSRRPRTRSAIIKLVGTGLLTADSRSEAGDKSELYELGGSARSAFSKRAPAEADAKRGADRSRRQQRLRLAVQRLIWTEGGAPVD
jgi:hypothetical protein